MQCLYPQWDVPRHIGALSTTRSGGASTWPYDNGAGAGGLNLATHVGDSTQDVERNRGLLRTLVPVRPAWLNQVHGTQVLDVSTTIPNAPNNTADASIATRGGVACAILTADCLPVLLCDASGRVVGAAHAGWRGLAAGVLPNTVQSMRDVGGDEIIAWLGPAIGPTRFEVGAEVLAAFVASFAAHAYLQKQVQAAFLPKVGSSGKYLADLYALARLSLLSAGVERIHGGGLCTASERRFYSYRRDGMTGRMASLIWIGERE